MYKFLNINGLIINSAEGEFAWNTLAKIEPCWGKQAYEYWRKLNCCLDSI